MKWRMFGFQWAVIPAILMIQGCATNPFDQADGAEKGAAGTIAYYVDVEANEPGIKIEVNGDYLGETPLRMKVFADRDGTFHNFGSPEFVVRALPGPAGGVPQVKVFRTGGWFGPEDMVPKRIYFDMRLGATGTGAAPPVPVAK